MKTKEIYVSVKFTKNLGNYQSFVAEAGLTVALDPIEAEEIAFSNAWEIAKGQVRNQLNSLSTKGEV